MRRTQTSDGNGENGPATNLCFNRLAATQPGGFGPAHTFHNLVKLFAHPRPSAAPRAVCALRGKPATSIPENGGGRQGEGENAGRRAGRLHMEGGHGQREGSTDRGRAGTDRGRAGTDRGRAGTGACPYAPRHWSSWVGATHRGCPPPSPWLPPIGNRPGAAGGGQQSPCRVTSLEKRGRRTCVRFCDRFVTDHRGGGRLERLNSGRTLFSGAMPLPPNDQSV